MQIIQSIQNRIYEIRGERVMLDRDLAYLYEVETKALNLALKRNIKRFPKDFMFQLTLEEWSLEKQQVEARQQQEQSLRFQSETLKKGRGQHIKYLPYAFTEQGVAMLSGILNSDRAAKLFSFPCWGKAGMGVESICRSAAGIAATKRFAGAVAAN